MKYLLLAIAIVPLTACQDASGPDAPDTPLKAGYVAGYQLICGHAWKAGNRFVVDKEFANDFLDGAIMCAREHPGRARQVLGLPDKKQTESAREADMRMEAACEAAEQLDPVSEEAPEQRISPAPPSHPKKPAKIVQAPQPAAKAAPKKEAPAKTAKAPAKAAKAPETTAKTPTKSTKSATTPAGGAAAAKAPVITVRPDERRAAAPAPKPAGHTPPVEEASEKRSRPRSPISAYDRFMGRE